MTSNMEVPMQTVTVTARFPLDVVEHLDRTAFERRLKREPGRSATRSAVLIDIVRSDAFAKRATPSKE